MYFYLRLSLLGVSHYLRLQQQHLRPVLLRQPLSLCLVGQCEVSLGVRNRPCHGFRVSRHLRLRRRNALKG